MADGLGLLASNAGTMGDLGQLIAEEKNEAKAEGCKTFSWRHI